MRNVLSWLVECTTDGHEWVAGDYKNICYVCGASKSTGFGA